MKSIFKIFTLLVILFMAVPTFASSSHDPKTKPTVEVFFLNGNAVQAGGLLKAELASNSAASVEVIVENQFGEVLGEKQIQIEKGSRLLKFKIEDAPAGEYTIKIYNGREVKSYPFQVI
jgi:hypothetical protein